MAISELDQIKQGARAVWAAGDYPAIAQRQLWPVGARVVRRVAVAPGEDVLDVACGTGNAALRAAAAGGRVVGLDLTPKLLEAGRELAAEAHVEIEWVEGDAEALPVADESFDVAISVFGCMFAPRHRIAAAELARVAAAGRAAVRDRVDARGHDGRVLRHARRVSAATARPGRAAASVGLGGPRARAVRGHRCGARLRARDPRSRRASTRSTRRSSSRSQVRAADHGARHARAAGPLGGAARRPAAPARATRRRRSTSSSRGASHASLAAHGATGGSRHRRVQRHRQGARARPRPGGLRADDRRARRGQARGRGRRVAGRGLCGRAGGRGRRRRGGGHAADRGPRRRLRPHGRARQRGGLRRRRRAAGADADRDARPPPRGRPARDVPHHPRRAADADRGRRRARQGARRQRLVVGGQGRHAGHDVLRGGEGRRQRVDRVRAGRGEGRGRPVHDLLAGLHGHADGDMDEAGRRRP